MRLRLLPAPRRLRRLCLAAALVTLAGCDRLLPGSGPPPQLYQLSPKSTFGEHLQLDKVRWQLTVEAPFAASALNTTRIAIMPSPMQLDYYARAAWTDRVPLMLQTLMVESFENSNRIIGVGRDTIGLRSDFVLKTELREFQAEAFDAGGGLVRVAIDAKLVEMPGRTIVAATEFRQTAPATIDEMPSVVAAFDDALGAVLKQLVVWTLRSGQASYANRPSTSAVPPVPTRPGGWASPPASPGSPAPTRRPSAPPAAPAR